MAGAADVEESSKIKELGAPLMPGASVQADASSSADASQRTDIDESAMKVRKPYTIKKPREKWTDEEHEKFVQALKQYGRNWGQIQEHIGTKTAVQIRSHAQKFFSKVEREPSTAKVIEIPPPRPKRKPVHPYPRKCKISNVVSNPAEQSEPSSLPSSSASVKEDGSLVSVLSAVHSDPSCSSLPDKSPHSSDGLEGIGCIDHDNGNLSCTTSDEETAPSASSPSPYIPNMVDKVGESTDLRLSEEEVVQETTLKLFGKTVVILETEKTCSAALTSELIAANSACRFDDHLTQRAQENRCVLVSEAAAPMCNYMPFNFLGVQQAAVIPLAWWYSTYANIVQLAGINNKRPSGRIEATNETDMHGSTGNDPGCSGCPTNEAMSFHQSCKMAELRQPACKLMPSKNSAFVRVQKTAEQPPRGFTPYKRGAFAQ